MALKATLFPFDEPCCNSGKRYISKKVYIKSDANSSHWCRAQKVDVGIPGIGSGGIHGKWYVWLIVAIASNYCQPSKTFLRSCREPLVSQSVNACLSGETVEELLVKCNKVLAFRQFGLTLICLCLPPLQAYSCSGLPFSQFEASLWRGDASEPLSHCADAVLTGRTGR